MVRSLATPSAPLPTDGLGTPAVTPSMAAWYKKQLEQFYADKPDRLQEIMSGNALKLMPELANMSS